jgi:CRISPR-associated protein Csd1
MARATIPKTKRESKTKPLSSTFNALFETAWRGIPLPVRLLNAAVARQCLELAKGRADDDKDEFEERLDARTALLKLYFRSHNWRSAMKNEQPLAQQPAAYRCGRVLALLDRIHNDAHGRKTSVSSPASRYYGSASSTPALVFPRPCKLSRYHLEKIGGGWAHMLEHGVPEQHLNGLAELIASFSADGKWPHLLSLEDQGRFAIGFYDERWRWANYEKDQSPTEGESSSQDHPLEDSELS